MPNTDILAARGPLGYENMRRQQGRSFDLGPAQEAPKNACRLVFTGSTDKGSQKPIGDSLASTMSLTCSIDTLAGPAARVIGKVEWGNDGHATECLFDWVRGTVVQVCGAQATLSAELLPAEVGPQAEIDPTTLVRVGAFVGYYPATKCVPTLTQYAAVPAAGVVEFAIPNNACRVYVYRATVPAPAAPDFTATWLTTGGAVLGALEAEAFRGGGAFGQPIPGASDRFAITNSVGPAALFSIVWSLHL
jgi:hypothetical protein